MWLLLSSPAITAMHHAVMSSAGVRGFLGVSTWRCGEPWWPLWKVLPLEPPRQSLSDQSFLKWPKAAGGQRPGSHAWSKTCFGTCLKFGRPAAALCVFVPPPSCCQGRRGAVCSIILISDFSIGKCLTYCTNKYINKCILTVFNYTFSTLRIIKHFI